MAPQLNHVSEPGMCAFRTPLLEFYIHTYTVTQIIGLSPNPKFFPYSREVTDRVTDPAKPKTITFTPCESVKNRVFRIFNFLI